ncbi:hypothetical protein Ddye_001732 [Dipteronia dyeriana]|uniref:Uncharacterized protein n=1 Tax=Dipteronia dyeriana TaxID=168575 RepID=A0AAD9XQE9_9ROSI|nr:hypothetical protein Ddye_001732 [Dipteronia dyeriana]
MQSMKLSQRMQLDELIFTSTCVMARVLFLLNMKSITVDDDKPSSYYVFFSVGLLGACIGSSCSVLIREKSQKIARFYRAFAITSMASSLFVLFWVAASVGFTWCFNFFGSYV